MLKASNHKIAALAVLMALTACGGGGGSSAPASSLGATTGSSSNAPSPSPSPSPSSSPSAAPGPAPVAAPVPAPAPTAASAPARAPVQVTSASVVSLLVARFPDGGHVVVWNSGGGTDTMNPGSVYAQIFDADEQKVGSPITVFSGGRGFASSGVAALPDGSFVVSGATTKVDTATNQLLARLFVQKVSASGQLLPTGGIPDADVNSGLADLVHSEDNGQLVYVYGGPFFANADGSYVLAMTRNQFQQQPVQETSSELLLNIDAAGIVDGQPVEIGTQRDGPGVAITRLSGGNFLFASTPMVPDGRGGFVFGPVTWKIVTNTGQVVAQQALGAGAGNPVRVTALADGTALLGWTENNARVVERIDGNGNVVGNASTPNALPGWPLGLAGGRYVCTWSSGSQILAQYFTSSGAAAGDPFVVADSVDTSASSTVAPTSDGFIVVYSATDKQVYEVQVKAPQFG